MKSPKMRRNPVRITFLTIIPSPYCLDLFAAIEADGRMLPRVLYMAAELPDTRWGRVTLSPYEELLKGGGKNIAARRVQWNLGVTGSISRSRPDLVVVGGYSSLTAQVAMYWLRWNRIPWIFWGEVPTQRRLSRWGRSLKALAQNPALHWADAIAGIGTVAVDEYRRLAPPGREVTNIPYYTELAPFLNQPRQTSPGVVRVLYCGQLIERKGVGFLLDAFLSLADEFPQLELLLVGDGRLRQPLAERVPARIQNRVTFAGFQPVDQLPIFFAASDLFVLPSLHDGWGVVVNQALGAGLPIICSSAVGAGVDLVTPGWNGEIVPPSNASALAEAIRSLASYVELRRTFGENSRIRARAWLPARGVDRWVELSLRVLGRRSNGVTTTAETTC